LFKNTVVIIDQYPYHECNVISQLGEIKDDTPFLGVYMFSSVQSLEPQGDLTQAIKGLSRT